MKYIILLIIVIAVLYVHYRGRVRYRFWRQLSDHSTFTAPLNGFMYLFSRVPNTPYLRPEMFPELAILQQNWQVIRDEGLHLQQLEQIKAADKYNDAGFKEGANKQVISSQADSLIKISRIWADFFPANTSNQPI